MRKLDLETKSVDWSAKFRRVSCSPDSRDYRSTAGLVSTPRRPNLGVATVHSAPPIRLPGSG